jgi:hypothetical protein
MIELAAQTQGFGPVFVLMYAVAGVAIVDVVVVAMIAAHFARSALTQVAAE